MKADEPMRKKVGNGHPVSANKGAVKRLLKDSRHLGGKRKRRRSR